MSAETVNADSLVPSDVLLVGDVRTTVLCPAKHGTETVGPLAGRPCIRYWCRREDTGAEGWMTYGPTGVALRINNDHVAVNAARDIIVI